MNNISYTQYFHQERDSDKNPDHAGTHMPDPHLEEKQDLWDYIKRRYPETIASKWMPDLNIEQFRAWAEYGDPRAFAQTRFTDERNLIESSDGQINCGTDTLPSEEYSNVQDIFLVGKLRGINAKYRAYRAINSTDPYYNKKKLIRELLDQLGPEYHNMVAIISDREINTLAKYTTEENYYRPSLERLLAPFIVNKAHEAGLVVQNSDVLEALNVTFRPRFHYYRSILENEVFLDDLSKSYEVYEDMTRTWIYKMLQSSMGKLVRLEVRSLLVRIEELFEVLPHLKKLKKNLSEVMALTVLHAAFPQQRLKDIAVILGEFSDCAAPDLYNQVKRLQLDYDEYNEYLEGRLGIPEVIEVPMSTSSYVHQPMKLGSSQSIIYRMQMALKDESIEHGARANIVGEQQLQTNVQVDKQQMPSDEIDQLVSRLPKDLYTSQIILTGMEGELARALMEILHDQHEDTRYRLILTTTLEQFRKDLVRVRGIEKLVTPEDIDQILSRVEIIEGVSDLERLMETLQDTDAIPVIYDLASILRRQIRSEILETGRYAEFLQGILQQEYEEYVELCKAEIEKEKKKLLTHGHDRENISNRMEAIISIHEQKIREFGNLLKEKREKWTTKFSEDYRTYHSTNTEQVKQQLSSVYAPQIPESVSQELEKLWERISHRPYILGYRTSRALNYNTSHQGFQYTTKWCNPTEALLDRFLFRNINGEMYFVNNVPNQGPALSYHDMTCTRITSLLKEGQEVDTRE